MTSANRAYGKIAFVTLGCAKNEVDSERMQARLRAAGFELTDDPEGSDAIIINTCSFITEATEEAIAAILEVAELEHFSRGSGRIIVAGCMPSRYGEDLAAELPEVSAFVPCAREENIVSVVFEVLGLPADELAGVGEPAFLRTTESSWAYVKIADGCGRRCSYCTIPLIRGEYQSETPERIVAEITGLVDSGVREIILIAQDTGIWGQDLRSNSEIKNLSDLLVYLARRFPATWFRVMYLQPGGITDELLDTMASYDNICNYLDIPLQHASAKILREMNRSGCIEEHLSLLARIREKLPDAVLRTTVITGFPGESDKDADELEAFIAAAEFDYVGIFAYSQEDGTEAGRRDDQVPDAIRLARMQRLRDLADSIGFSKVARRIQTTEEVLVTGYEEDSSDDPYPVLGRTKRQAPEVDGMTHLDQGRIGELLSATMIDAYCYELDGRRI